MYNRGHGVPQDNKEAVKWFRLAADQGFAGAQYSLGGLYVLSTGVSQDYQEASKWYRLSAEQGNAKAQFIVATRHAAKQLAGKSFPDRPQ